MHVTWNGFLHASPRPHFVSAAGALAGSVLVAALQGTPARATSSAFAQDGPAASRGPSAPRGASAEGPRLPLGRPDVPEVRRVRSLAKGLTWTTVRRGVKPATPASIPTTARGPWNVNIVAIDPRTARGRLEVSAGADLRRTERTSVLARSTKAIVAVNGGFFAHTASKEAPGDPIGLGVLRGTLTSEPLRGSAAVGMTIDNRTKRLDISAFTWSATVQAGTVSPIVVHGVNRLPASGWTCLLTPNQDGSPPPVADTESGGPPATPTDSRNLGTCHGQGELIRFTGHWGAHTPAGPGAEVIVDRAGCLVRTRSLRGGPLSPGHVSYQATGTAARRLLDLGGTGCLSYRQRLLNARGETVQLKPSTYAVNGRQVLVRDGRIVETRAGRGFAGRNPRTIVGRTAGGTIALVTIDGRRTTSVGASLAEAARVAKSIGLVEAVNLDGGGSTTLVVHGKVVNQVSGKTERAVGDALVYRPS